MKIDEVWVHACIKVGQEKYMKRLISKGEIFMKPIRNFQRSGNFAHDDTFEGATGCIQGANALLQWQDDNGIFRDLGNIPGPIAGIPEWAKDINAYCLYGVQQESIDPRVREFGDTCVIFTKVEEFFSRVKKKLRNRGYSFDVRAVEYVPQFFHNGRMGPNTKFSNFGYQSEVRITSRTCLRKDLCFEIGSLRDIARIAKLDELTPFLRRHAGLPDGHPIMR